MNYISKIGEINKYTENKIKVVCTGLIITLIFLLIFKEICPFNFKDILKPENFIQIMFLPICVLITLIIHELIHIACFKIFGKGQSIIKVKREKSIGAIVIQQINTELYYSKIESLIILVMPFIAITLISLGFIFVYSEIKLLLILNCILNEIGSTIDIYVIFKLIIKYPLNLKISYSGDNIGMQIYI